MSGLGANQIVASIVGWPDNHVMRGEYFERALQNRRREVWTVAIECDDVPAAVKGTDTALSLREKEVS